jgi:hypothetical protein
MKKMDGKISDRGLRVVHAGATAGYPLWSLMA